MNQLLIKWKNKKKQDDNLVNGAKKILKRLMNCIVIKIN